jgi:hypothetical protein
VHVGGAHREAAPEDVLRVGAHGTHEGHQPHHVRVHQVVGHGLHPDGGAVEVQGRSHPGGVVVQVGVVVAHHRAVAEGLVVEAADVQVERLLLPAHHRVADDLGEVGGLVPVRPPQLAEVLGQPALLLRDAGAGLDGHRRLVSAGHAGHASLADAGLEHPAGVHQLELQRRAQAQAPVVGVVDDVRLRLDGEVERVEDGVGVVGQGADAGPHPHEVAAGHRADHEVGEVALDEVGTRPGVHGVGHGLGRLGQRRLALRGHARAGRLARTGASQGDGLRRRRGGCRFGGRGCRISDGQSPRASHHDTRHHEQPTQSVHAPLPDHISAGPRGSLMECPRRCGPSPEIIGETLGVQSRS